MHTTATAVHFSEMPRDNRQKNILGSVGSTHSCLGLVLSIATLQTGCGDMTSLFAIYHASRLAYKQFVQMCVLAVGVRSSIPCEDNDFSLLYHTLLLLLLLLAVCGTCVYTSANQSIADLVNATLNYNDIDDATQSSNKPFTIITKTVTAENRRFLKSRHTIHSYGSSCDSWSGNSTAQAIFSVRKFKEYKGKFNVRTREI